MRLPATPPRVIAPLAALLLAAVMAPVLAATAPPAKPSLTLASGLNSTRVGDITVHYNALPTLQLSPEVARRSGITRSANRALLNVAVQRGATAATSVAVPARVEAAATNPAGQRQALNLREVREGQGEAIYYLGEARIDGRDTLDFELVVSVEGGEPIRARFRQEFWPATPGR